MIITYKKPNWYVDDIVTAATIPDMHRILALRGIDKRAVSTACAMAKRFARPITIGETNNANYK